MEKFKIADEANKAKVISGEMTDQAYKEWRQKAMLNNARVEKMINDLSVDMSYHNQRAKGYINARVEEVYGYSYNYQMWEIETKAKVITEFGVYDKNVIRNLAVIPQAPTKLAKDIMWHNKKIRSAITQGILQGESIPKIAKRLQTVTDMDKRAAIRNARTLMTSAQNEGRMEGLKYAESLGIKVKKQWLATLDDRTRDSHVLLDGEVVEVDEEFSNGLMFPADMNAGDPAEVYNCRCTMLSVVEGLEPSVNPDEVRRANKLGDMSYEEWKRAHEKMNIDVQVESNRKEVMNEKERRLRAAMKAIALTAEDYAKEACPVDTGRLKNSISNSSDEVSATIGTNVEYAVYVELGSSKWAPNGYLRISLADHIDEYEAMLENELNRG